MPLLKTRLKKTFEFSELNSVLFKINYLHDKLIIECEGVEINKSRPERKETDELKPSEHSEIADILLSKVKKFIDYDKITMIYFNINFTTNGTNTDVYYVKNERKQMQSITSIKL